MSNKTFLQLPADTDNFEELRINNEYYVDKTLYIKDVLSPWTSRAQLFTRPKGFGKTMFMSMLGSFLSIDSKNPGDTSVQQKLFKGTRITEDREFCEKYMGQHPVIYINLKDAYGDNFEEAYLKFAEIITSNVKEYSYLKDSPAFSDNDKNIYAIISDHDFLKTADSFAKSYATSALQDLTVMLYKHFKKKVCVFIDDYEMPWVKAYENDYHEDMIMFMAQFLDYLKEPPRDYETGCSVAERFVLTGTLKVVKNSITGGLNNLNFNTVNSLKSHLTGVFGFTEDEILKTLKDYKLEDCAELVKDSYGGYRFFDREIFCPKDVIRFVNDNCTKKLPEEKITADSYLSDTASDPKINKYIENLTDHDTQKLQDLIDGKSVRFRLEDSTNYDCLSENRTDNIWSLLFHKGYLTVDSEKTDEIYQADGISFNRDIFARIPNLKTRECFTDNIKERFSNVVSKDSLADKIACSLLDGDDAFVQSKLGPLLRSFVSVRDSATKAPHENYYHGFLNGLFSNCSKGFFSEYHSNSESGDGYPDIFFTDADSRKVAIIEIKSSPVGSDFVTASENALSQIEEKNYAEPMMTNRAVMSIYAYGIAFAGKACAVCVKRLK